MMERRDLRSYGSTGVGASSILLIGVVLALGVFGALALLSARMDQNLSDKTVAATQAYYAADAKAQETIAKIDAQLAAVQPVSAENVTLEGESASFSIAIDENRALFVKLSLEQSAQPRYNIICYKVTSTGDWAADQTLNLR